MTMLNIFVDLVLLIICIITGIRAFYIKSHAQEYTRERFSFYAVGLIASLGTLSIKSITKGDSVWQSIPNMIRAVRGDKTPSIEPSSWSDHALIFLLFLVACSFITTIYRSWNGGFSLEDFRRVRKREEQTWLAMGVADVVRRIARQAPPPRYAPEEIDYRPRPLPIPGGNLAWHIQARELFELKSKGFRIDPSGGWREDHRCWVGENLYSSSMLLILCAREAPDAEVLLNLVNYGTTLSAQRRTEYYVAVETGGRSSSETINGTTVTVITQNDLLTGLIDFSDYHREIEYAVEKRFLPDSELAIGSIYVESRILTEDNTPVSDTLEVYLRTWLNESGGRQLALLGEYGEGKSTGALMFAYHLIKQHTAALLSGRAKKSWMGGDL